MKCVGCGAQIDMDQQVCPYCGRVNDLALQRSMHLENLEERNRREGKEIVEKSRMEIFCRVHRWVNVGLAVAVVIAAVASFGFFYYYEYGFSFDKAKPGEIRELYEANFIMRCRKVIISGSRTLWTVRRRRSTGIPISAARITLHGHISSM